MTMTETQLVLALKAGQRGALDQAIRRYSGFAAAVIRSVLGSSAVQEDLEELVSDTFLALWRAADRLEETRPLRHYLAAIARHAAIDRLRQQRPANPLPADDLLPADEADSPEAQALRREQTDTLRRLLYEMATEDREIFVRFYYYEQTVREIASIMQKNESTVKARLSRGRARLRAQLEKEGTDHAYP